MKTSISAKIFWLAMVINVLGTVGHTVIAYQKQSEAFLEGIDKKLRAAAYALPLMLPADLHDKITGSDSISPEEHSRRVADLSDYADKVKIRYIYTYMKFGNAFRIATTSATKKERESKKTDPFFKKYENPPPEMIAAWKTNQLHYASRFIDRYGIFHSIFIPMKTAAGTPYIIGADVSSDYIPQKLKRTLAFHVGVGVGIFFFIWICSYIIIKKITVPLENLSTFITELASGDFQLSEKRKEELDLIVEQYNDEVGRLAAAFSKMQRTLREYIEKITAAKERIESELNIAHNIQMGLLKRLFPAFPERSEFDLYAIIAPAREVGGDLYDFCLLDDDSLFFYVGDVSDKGVPAALFMAVTMTLMMRTAQAEYASSLSTDPSAILRKVNSDLLGVNENLLFVTLACFILNLKTGTLTYSNAGHNPPVILRKDGTAEWLPLPRGIVLGIMPDAVFSTRSAQLHPGDKIILVTDGVTEAMNREEIIYSTERFIKTVGQQNGKNSKEIATALMSSVTEYADGAPVSDDIAIMALGYNG